MQGHDFACRFAGLLVASALGIGSAAASSISLKAEVNSPWSAGAAGVTYSSVTGLVITSDPVAYGSVFGSGALNLTSNLVRVQLNKPEIYGGYPHSGSSLSSVSLSAGTIRVDAKGVDTVLLSDASFSDTVTFFNPNSTASQIHVVWNVDGSIGAGAVSGGGSLVFGAALLSFAASEYGIEGSANGWPSAPEISERDLHSMQFIAPYTLAPGISETRQLSMFLGSYCSGQFGNFCGYRETLRFDLGNTGVTFTSGSGLLLSAVVPEPGTLGLSLMGTALTALIVLRRKRMRP